MKAFLTLLKSEHLEHRGGQLWTPVILGGLIIILLIAGMLHEGSMIISLASDNSEVTIRTVEDAHRVLRDEIGEEKIGPVLQGLAFASSYFGIAILMIVAAVVSYFQMVGSMHNERADRSVLFWKSMPVSDIEVTLAKFVSATFGTILLAGVIGVAVSAIGIIVHSISGPLGSTPEWGVIIHPSVIASTLTLGFSLAVFYVLWAAPVYAWILLASAWAPRSPLLYVAVPPVAIGILELLTTREGSWLWREIGSRVSGSMLRYDGTVGNAHHTAGSLSRALMQPVSEMVVQAAASPRFWLGLVLAALFIWGASEIRRRRIA
ncbi:MAG TPA: hypothetical protein VIG90_13055 [Pedomonas sp.]|uniref:hypothetical protein n=1 Tax=Pedomonas sp. TaxID=2976421 RepID=UPI002F40633F